MKAERTQEAAALVKALKVLPSVGRALSDKPGKYHDCTWLELQAAEMAEGESQGTEHYADVPPRVGRKIVAAARKIIEAELRSLGVRFR